MNPGALLYNRILNPGCQRPSLLAAQWSPFFAVLRLQLPMNCIPMRYTKVRETDLTGAGKAGGHSLGHHWATLGHRTASCHPLPYNELKG